MQIVLLTTPTAHHHYFADLVKPDRVLYGEPSYENLKELNADVYIVFGLNRLKGDILTLPLINVHRGDSEQYRGLDSLWWALWDKNKEGLKVTIHFIDEELDTGDIIIQKPVKIKNLYDLLFDSTRVAAEAVIEALEIYYKEGKFPRRKAKRGKYYSTFPKEYKDEIRKRPDDFIVSWSG